MCLDDERRGSGDMRRRHRRAGQRQRSVAAADERRHEANAGSDTAKAGAKFQDAERILAEQVPGLRRVAGAGQRDRLPVTPDQREASRGRTCRKAADAVERDGDDELLTVVGVRRDRTLERRQRGRVVDHHDGGRAGLLTEDRASHARARAALCDNEFAGYAGGRVLVPIAAEAHGAVGIAQHLDFQRPGTERRAVAVDRLDRLRGETGRVAGNAMLTVASNPSFALAATVMLFVLVPGDPRM